MPENDRIRLTPDDEHGLTPLMYERTPRGRHWLEAGCSDMLLSNAEALAFARQLPELKVLVEACHRAPLATIAHRMDVEGGGGDCVRRILDALTLFQEAPDANAMP